MEKGNKIRLTVWGFIWLCVVIGAITGIYSYYNGNGESGKIRKELMPIINIFNNLTAFNTYKNVGIKIESQLEKDGIKVTYNSQASKLTFMFYYEVIDNEKTLHIKYNKVDETTGILVTSSMFEAISVKNGHLEGDLFEKYGYGDLYNTSISQGGMITVDANTTNAYININKTLLDTINNNDIEKSYINNDDITTINTELSNNNVFMYTKENNKLYIESTVKKYIIYFRNGSYDDNAHKSLLTIINNLELNDLIKESFTHSYPTITSSTEFGNYIITLDADVANMEYFTEKDKVIKIEIKKENVD